MPAPVLAALVAAVCSAFTGWTLRRLPAPPEAPDQDFSALNSTRFRVAVFVVSFTAGWLVLAVTEPRLWPIWAPLAGLGSLLGLIDAHTTFLPLRLHYACLGLVVAGVVVSAAWRGSWWTLAWAAAGWLFATAVYGLVWRVSRGQLGFGDVRLAGLIGVAAGATDQRLIFATVLAGSLIGALWAIIARLRGNRGFAYGPSLLLGAPVALVLVGLLPQLAFAL